MSKPTIHAVVDAAAFVAFVFLAATGSLIKFVLPPGSGHFSTMWGMDRHEWGDVHYVFALAFLTVVACHLVLHWHWIAFTVQGRSGKRVNLRIAIAVLGLLVLLGLAASPYLAGVESKDDSPHKTRSEKSVEGKHVKQTNAEGKRAEEKHIEGEGKHAEGSLFSIDGTMSLGEVERMTGVSAAVIVKELGLPTDVPVDERLGRLRKEYGFEMRDLREIVEKNSKKRENRK